MRARHWLAGVLLGIASCAFAQLTDPDPDWKESDVPAPPAFDVGRVIDLEMPRHMTVKLGVDPETMRVTGDGVVRYVMVARSPGGTVNATYEGIRCQTGEVKVYARYTASKVWTAINNPGWTPLRNHQPSPHALAFARQGACEGRSATTNSTQAIIRKLKSGDAALHTK